MQTEFFVRYQDETHVGTHEMDFYGGEKKYRKVNHHKPQHITNGSGSPTKCVGPITGSDDTVIFKVNDRAKQDRSGSSRENCPTSEMENAGRYDRKYIYGGERAPSAPSEINQYRVIGYIYKALKK